MTAGRSTASRGSTTAPQRSTGTPSAPRTGIAQLGGAQDQLGLRAHPASESKPVCRTPEFVPVACSARGPGLGLYSRGNDGRAAPRERERRRGSDHAGADDCHLSSPPATSTPCGSVSTNPLALGSKSGSRRPRRRPTAEDLDLDGGIRAPRTRAAGRRRRSSARRCSRSRRSSPARRSRRRCRTGSLPRATERGSPGQAHEPLAAPRSFAFASASRPMNPPSLSSLTQKPTPPSYGVSSGVMSAPQTR